MEFIRIELINIKKTSFFQKTLKKQFLNLIFNFYYYFYSFMELTTLIKRGYLHVS